MPVKLSLEQRNLILDDYEEGIPVEKIALKYGVHHSYPTLLARRAGLMTRNNRPNTLFKKAKRK